MGGTRVQSVDLDPSPGAHEPSFIVSSVELDSNESKLENVGVFAWGKYDEDDRANLASSFQLSSARFAGEQPHRVYVVVRRALVAASNNEGFAVACVGWAIVGPTGDLMFAEQFYAREHGVFTATLGGVKDAVHEGILRRVLGVARHVAAGGSLSELPPFPRYTYATYDEATDGLPTDLTSIYVSLNLGGGSYTYVENQTTYLVTYQGGISRVDTFTGSSGLAWAERTDQIDWRKRLGIDR